LKQCEVMSVTPAVDMQIRLRRREDDPEIVALRNEGHPFLPGISVEEYRRQADRPDRKPGTFEERFVAVRDGRILGLYVLSENYSATRPGTFLANVGVAAEWRGKGIGSALFRHLLEQAAEHNAQRIYGSVFEGDDTSLRFATNHGLAPTGRVERLSRLDVKDARLEGYQGTLARLESEGLAFRRLDEIGLEDEHLLRAVADLSYQSARDIPTSETWEQSPFEEWRKEHLEAADQGPERIWIALDGHTPVGVAALRLRGHRGLMNGYTGVDRAYRGRGIARALKLKAIEYARAEGFEFILTGNDAENHRMLDINIRLGYRMLPGEIEILREL